jgi:four helix bundle protein
MEIKSCQDLRVYKISFEMAMKIFSHSQSFPRHELYSMADQIRRSSRSVCTSIAEAWRKRSYPLYFVSKLSDAEAEAEETRVWLQFADRCGYLESGECQWLDEKYDHILSQLSIMIQNPEKWCNKA